MGGREEALAGQEDSLPCGCGEGEECIMRYGDERPGRYVTYLHTYNDYHVDLYTNGPTFHSGRSCRQVTSSIDSQLCPTS